MITDSFDPSGETLFTPEAFFGEQKHFGRLAVVTYSDEILENALQQFPHEIIGHFGSVNGMRPIYLLDIGDRKVICYLSSIGSAMAGTQLIEINWLTGAEQFIVFGLAGSLHKETTENRYVIPTEAFRDEGLSYHYAPAADYIAVRQSNRMAECFEKLGLPYVQGRIWTTDAFYRETRSRVAQRKAEGCIAVEMEIAGMQAVSDFHGFELYPFLVTGDILDQPQYSYEGLSEANHAMGKFHTALALARLLS